MSERVVRRGGSCMLEILIAGLLLAFLSVSVLRLCLELRNRTRYAHTQTVLASLSASIAMYRANWSVAPVGSNADMVRALSAEDRHGPCLSISAVRLNEKGELLDAWGNPFNYTCPMGRDRDSFRLYSHGPNGTDEKGEGDDMWAQ